MQTIKKATHISTTRRLLPQFRILFLTVCKAVCKPALKFAAFPQGSGAGFLLYVVQANMIYAPRAEPFSRGKTPVKPLRVAASKGRIAPPENQHTFFFFHCLYFLSCTGQNCFDIITEAIQRHTAVLKKQTLRLPRSKHGGFPRGLPYHMCVLRTRNHSELPRRYPNSAKGREKPHPPPCYTMPPKKVQDGVPNLKKAKIPPLWAGFFCLGQAIRNSQNQTRKNRIPCAPRRRTA